MTAEILIIIAAMIVGIFASRLYTKYKGPLFFSRKPSTVETEEKTTFKDLKKQDKPLNMEIFFIPSLQSVISDEAAVLGRPLNENEFNHIKNNAFARFVDVDDIRDWQELNKGRTNNFSFKQWQNFQKEDGIS